MDNNNKNTGIEPSKQPSSLANRTLRATALRIGMVAICAGAISYFVNQSTVEDSIRKQLLLSTQQTLQRESLPFREIRELERNFLDEFKTIYAAPGSKQRLVRDFEQIFYRHADGSYTQRPGLFEGKPLADGRRYAKMSATYAPDIPPSDDTKARFALAYELSHKFGSTAQGRLFNFYGVVPEKGFPIYQDADIAQAFSYSGPEALKLETYEFYSRGFSTPGNEPFFTRMYWDPSNNAWMTTVATPDVADASGKHRMLACVDVLLDELMRRIAHPAIEGSHSVLFLNDAEGTLIYHPEHMDEVKRSEGKASIQSLQLENEYPLLAASRHLAPGKVELIEADHEIIAIGLLPETPGVFSIHYPKSLMLPAILQNIAIVVVLGLVTLLVEIFILRSVLQNQVAQPLSRLIRATRLVGQAGQKLGDSDLPTRSGDEIGDLARSFAHMAGRIEDAQRQLEAKVQERTVALEEANRKLTAMSATDELTGLPNRRRFNEALANEWRRAQRAGTPLALAMIDVDWFKNYNDRYGHQAGDECLHRVAHILETHLQRAGDLVARYGGEEFALIITADNAEHARNFAASLCAAVQAAGLPHDASPLGWVTVSIGLACARAGDVETPEALLKKADEALYRAKAQGRNRTCLL